MVGKKSVGAAVLVTALLSRCRFCSALPAVVAAVPSLLVAPLPVVRAASSCVSSLDVLAVLLRVRFSFFNLFICFLLKPVPLVVCFVPRLRFLFTIMPLRLGKSSE